MFYLTNKILTICTNTNCPAESTLFSQNIALNLQITSILIDINFIMFIFTIFCFNKTNRPIYLTHNILSQAQQIFFFATYSITAHIRTNILIIYRIERERENENVAPSKALV